MINVDTIWLMIIAGLALLLIWRWRTNRLTASFLMAGLIALTIIDLGRIDQQMIAPQEGVFRSSVQQPAAAVTRYITPDPVIRFLQKEPAPFRIYPLGALQSESRWAAFGLSSIGGYHPAKLANYERLMQATGFKSVGVLQMLNVHYLIAQQRIDDARFTQVFVGNMYHRDRYVPAAVYRFEKGMARAWFPKVVQVISSADSLLARLAANEFDPQIAAYTVGDQDGGTVLGGQGVITAESWSPSHIALTVEVEREGLLVLSEIYYPQGWVARIAGSELPIVEVNTVLRGVVVPQGDHQLTLDFEPQDVMLGRWISQLALVLLLAAFVPTLYSTFRKVS